MSGYTVRLSDDRDLETDVAVAAALEDAAMAEHFLDCRNVPFITAAMARSLRLTAALVRFGLSGTFTFTESGALDLLASAGDAGAEREQRT